MKQMMVTGHRPKKLGNEYDNMAGPYSKALIRRFTTILLEEEVEHGIEGGALGTDTIFGFTCLELGIRLTVAVPCREMYKLWSKESIAMYKYITGHPLTTVHLVSDQAYFDGCMQIRNRWMVDQLSMPEDKAVEVWDGSPGGTKNCHDYLITKVPLENIIRINPQELLKGKTAFY